jgi:hypothetical protein
MTKIHQGLTPKLWSAAAGGVAVSIIGFSALGWTLGSTADRMAAQRADAAVVSVLAPICVQNFRQQSDSTAKLIEFKKASSWDQRSLVEKVGWAKMPGVETTNSAVVSVCAEKIGQLS